MPSKTDTTEYFEGPECGQENCRSKLFFEQDGFTYCKGDGHQQEGQRTQQDDDDLRVQGRIKTRAIRDIQEKASQVRRGHTAVSLYLQCYQLVLWKQCYALIHTIGLPSELEILVKDLWALRLQLLKDKINATPEEEAVFSSQPVSEESDNDALVSEKKWKTRGNGVPTLAQTLALLYIGMVLLRLPIGMGDLHRCVTQMRFGPLAWESWAVQEDIPFIRAVRFVPTLMKERLPSEYLMALDTTSPLEPDNLHKTIRNVTLLYAHQFKMKLPPVNASLLLYKYVRNLALPVTLHSTTQSIAALLNIKFTFPTPDRRQKVSSFPEIALVGLLVIATKLYHPFDNGVHPRHARSPNDPAALAIDWLTWATAQKAHTARLNPEGHLARGSEIRVTEADVMNMTGNEMNEYLDWYERTYVDETRVKDKKNGISKELLEMFPTGRQDGFTPTSSTYSECAKKENDSHREKLRYVMARLQVQPVASRDEPDGGTEPMIGDFYRRYRTVEELEEVPRLFHETVAEAAGIKLETLLVAVGQLERKLIKFQEARVKAGGAKHEAQNSASAGADATAMETDH